MGVKGYFKTLGILVCVLGILVFITGILVFILGILEFPKIRHCERSEAISRNSKFLLAFGLDKSSPARKFYKGYALNL